MVIGYSLRMCARYVDSTNRGRSNLVFRSNPIAEAEMSNRLIIICVYRLYIQIMGPSIKYVTLWEGVPVCDRGRGSRACDVTLIIFVSHIWNMKFKVMFNSVVTDVLWHKGERTKTNPDKTFQTKRPRTKPPDKSPREQLKENLYSWLLSGFSY